MMPQIFAVEHLHTLPVNDGSLGVHHVIVFQNALSGAEVPAFHVLLGIFHGTGQDLRINGGIFIQSQGVHHAHDPVGGEQTHQIVFQTQVEPAFTGVTLTAGTAAQLVVDAAALMALGADDVQAAGLEHAVVLAVGLLLEGGVEPWIGAGVKTKEQLERCVQLGAKLVTTDDPGQTLRFLRELGAHE